ncbi:hypothetical protein BH11BAC5_BH11BAC5_40760 [soil metagenome]
MESKTLFHLDARDCALYYAEWWKRCYSDGLPSKRLVYNSIANNQHFDEEMFFQHAKKGANLLGIQWIKNQNTLYFRTLLLQGGLPIKHISNNRGAYKTFLLKIIELNPKSIDDFAFDLSITSLLPPSSRNDEIFECCLNIVQAIINEDLEYLSILECNQDLKDIGNELRIKKQHLSYSRKKTRLRVYWVLEPEKQNIRLYIGIPDMSLEDFNEIVLSKNNSEPLEYEYKLYYNDKIACKFIQKGTKQYKVVWINQDDIVWDGTDQFSEVFLISTSGKKYDCQHIISNYPNINQPTMWTKYSEAELILEKGTHTKQNEGYVLVPNDYFFVNDTGDKDVTICGKLFKWIRFNNTVIVHNQSKHYQFKANSKNIEWYVSDQKPTWMQKPTMTVVRGKPKIHVYDENGNLVNNPIFKWKPKAGNFWKEWIEPLPLGFIELKVQAGSIEKAVALASQSDVAVLCVGWNNLFETEGYDKEEGINLPGFQEELIQAVAAVNPNTIVVINSGTPVFMESWAQKVNGIILAYYPGHEGGNALASLLFGDKNPSGKLPFTFIADSSQAPGFKNYMNVNPKIKYEEGLYVGYRYIDKNNLRPTYPFGFGLSYTTFAITGAKAMPLGSNTYAVNVSVKNTGDRAGEEVVQLYVRANKPTVDKPVKELKAFAKVMLAPGETKQVMMYLPQRAFMFYNTIKNNWETDPGKYSLLIGNSSQNTQQVVTVDIKKSF